MKILCTGGAGYVGSACLRYLLAEGHDALAFDDLSTGNRAAVPEGRLVVGDILDGAALVELLRSEQIEAVLHFAAAVSVPESIVEPERYWRVNLEGTRRVAEAARAAGVGRLVASSTAAVYGDPAELPLREDAPTRPLTPYGRSKLAAEWLLADYARAHGLGVGLLRYFNAAGADRDGRHGEARPRESHLVPLVLGVALGQRERLQIFGQDWETRDGTCLRDYVHVEDLARAHLACLEALRPGDVRTYNLGSGHGTTVNEVLHACEAVVGRPIPHEVVARRPGDPPALVASAERIHRELGWEARVGEMGAIVETAWRWHSRHPSGYQS